MAEPKKPDEIRDSFNVSADAWEKYKDRGKDESVIIPPATFETSINGEKIDSGKLAE